MPLQVPAIKMAIATIMLIMIFAFLLFFFLPFLSAFLPRFVSCAGANCKISISPASFLSALTSGSSSAASIGGTLSAAFFMGFSAFSGISFCSAVAFCSLSGSFSVCVISAESLAFSFKSALFSSCFSVSASAVFSAGLSSALASCAFSAAVKSASAATPLLLFALTISSFSILRFLTSLSISSTS